MIEFLNNPACTFYVIIATLLAMIIYPSLTRHTNNLKHIGSLLLIAMLFINIIYIADYHFAHHPMSLTLLTITPLIKIELVTEKMGLIFATMSIFLWFLTYSYSIGYMGEGKETINDHKNMTRFYTCLALAMSCVVLISLAGNLFTTFVFYELLTLTTYPLVNHFNDPISKAASNKYLTILMSSSIGLLLPAIAITYHFAGSLDYIPTGILGNSLPQYMKTILILLYMFGVAKIAIMPFHSWLPAAMVAPTPVSALLHAVAVVKTGIFVILKILVGIFGLASAGHTASILLFTASSVTIIIASYLALKQDSLKARLAYSTISQLSYCILAASILTPQGINASLCHMVAHAFAKIGLFFAAGGIYLSTYKTKISEMSGIGKKIPLVMACFTICACSVIGLPPSIGFISKFYILSSSADNLAVIVMMIIGTILSSAYFVPLIYQIWWGKMPNSLVESPLSKQISLTILLPILTVTMITLLPLLFYHILTGINL